MTTQHKTEKAERLAAFAAALARWQALDSRSELGAAMLRATRHYNTPRPTTAVENSTTIL